jgi:hypothetical protein
MTQTLPVTTQPEQHDVSKVRDDVVKVLGDHQYFAVHLEWISTERMLGEVTGPRLQPSD